MKSIKILLPIIVLWAASVSYAQTTISAVYVQSSTSTTATIVWTTSTPSTSQIKYGYDSSIPFSNNENYNLVTSHSMTLTLLNASQPYYFAVVSVDGSGHSAQSSTYQFALCGTPDVPVSGTVNQFYYDGTYSITWNAPSGSSGTPTICGQTLQQTVSGSLNLAGTFTAQVGDALKVTPGPGTWTVSVADSGNLSPISVTLPLSTNTQDISSQLQTAASSAGLVGVIANDNAQTVYPSWLATLGPRYPSPSLNSIPKVTNPASPGTLGNSSCSDNGSTFSCTEPTSLSDGSSAVTQTIGDNSTKVATDAFVQSVASSSISGQANGVIPLSTGTNTIGAQSHINENTPGYETFTQAISGTSASFSDTVAAAKALQVGPIVTDIGGVGSGFDADVTTGAKIGGGTATDNTTYVNGLLAAGSSTSPAQVNLCGGTVTTGVRIPAYGNVEIDGCGWNSGFFLKSGSNSFGISDATPSTPPWFPFDPGQFPALNPGTPSISGYSSVVLRNFTLNGNLGTFGGCTGDVDCTLSSSYSNGSEKGYETLAPPGTTNIGSGAFPSSPTSGQIVNISNGSSSTDCSTRSGTYKVACFWSGSAWTPAGNGSLFSFPWYTGIDLNSHNRVLVDTVQVLNAPTYGIRIGNVNDGLVINSTVTQTTFDGTGNHDCIHFDGPGLSERAINNTCNNIDDDAITFNGPEGYGGTISDAYAEGNVCNNCNDMGLVYDIVNEERYNERGTFNVTMYRVGGTGTLKTSGNIMTSLNANAPYIEVPPPLITGHAYTSITSTNDEEIYPANANAGNPAFYVYSATNEGPLTINNFKLIMQGTGTQAPALVGMYNTLISRITINGFEMVNSATETYTMASLVNCAAGATVQELDVNGVVPTGITALYNNSLCFLKIGGTALAANPQWQLNDAQILNGVLYYSGVNYPGQLCVKIGGTVGSTDGTPIPFAMLGANTFNGNQTINTGSLLVLAGRVSASAGLYAYGLPTANYPSTGGLGWGSGNTNLYSWGSGTSIAGGYIFNCLSSDASINRPCFSILPGGDVAFTNTTIPVVSSCGGGTITGNDNSFQVTGISAATSCTITFASALSQGFCNFNGAIGTVTTPSGAHTTSITVGISSSETGITGFCR